ncbi:MAG: SUMF1/EgtB/PvdO family nonheme iron enzyme, partial [Verrucomicrobia bacterium]|nr:SUMF1/EgtB/PvdO family nonheme iron enzyme [Verrucomicrobiota bacterium]
MITTLCPTDYSGGAIQTGDAYAALLSAHAAVDLRLAGQLNKPASAKLVKRLQGWLVGIIAQSALSPIERAEAGRWLSALGDPREDVSGEIPFTVPVTAGEFVIGSDAASSDADEKPQHRVKLPAYRIGKYPVTNAQYRRFVEDKGYTEKWRNCWTD